MKTIQIPDNLHHRLKIVAANKETNIVDLIKEGAEIILKMYEDADITYIENDGSIIKKYYKKGN